MALDPLLALSLFSSGPDDDAVAVDARGNTPKTTLAKNRKPQPTPQSKAIDRLKNYKFNANDAAQIVSLKNGGGLDKTSALRQLDQLMGQNLSGVAGDNDSLREKAGGNLIDLVTDGEYATIIDDAGQTIQLARGADGDKATSLMKSVKAFSGLDTVGDYVDGNPYLATGLALLDKAVEYGIPQAIDTIMDKVRKERLAKARLVEGLRGAVLRGDLKTINKILDITGVENAVARIPQITTLILAGFRFAPRTPESDYPGLKVELLATLVRINPKWDVIVRAGEEIPNLAPFRTATSSSKTLLLLDGDETWRVQCLIGQKFRYQNLLDLAKAQYAIIQAWLR